MTNPVDSYNESIHKVALWIVFISEALNLLTQFVNLEFLYYPIKFSGFVANKVLSPFAHITYGNTQMKQCPASVFLLYGIDLNSQL